mmetsp:Transcript_3765/g.9909  ORF Transcript_3765/g.9909 Transcript_3765/m.9909 type:complete len:89 (+) Transcript_3765:246-512(+)
MTEVLYVTPSAIFNGLGPRLFTTAHCRVHRKSVRTSPAVSAVSQSGLKLWDGGFEAAAVVVVVSSAIAVVTVMPSSLLFILLTVGTST